MRTLDRLTAFHGRLSDLRAVWWPFGVFRPERHEPISFKRALAMTPCFAAWFTVVWSAKQALFQNSAALTVPSVATAYAYAALGFLLWFNTVTAPLWNRRARQLANELNPPAPLRR